jgi:hypothetical protein
MCLTPLGAQDRGTALKADDPLTQSLTFTSTLQLTTPNLKLIDSELFTFPLHTPNTNH